MYNFVPPPGGGKEKVMKVTNRKRTVIVMLIMAMLITLVPTANVSAESIAYLTEEQIKMFQSDFGIIADYFVKRRKGYKTIENHKQIKHVDEMLKFMRIFVEDERF